VLSAYTEGGFEDSDHGLGEDVNKVALFLWLYGPAGAGKSAIAQTIVELLAAAFSLSRNAAGCNDKTRLVATLIYQLIKSIPEIRAHVLEAVEQDPALFSYSIGAQIQALIVKPLNAAANEEALAPILLSRPRFNYPGWTRRMSYHLGANPDFERPFHSHKTSLHSAFLPHRESTRAGYPTILQ
jgi:hypothetical protein